MKNSEPKYSVGRIISFKPISSFDRYVLPVPWLGENDWNKAMMYWKPKPFLIPDSEVKYRYFQPKVKFEQFKIVPFIPRISINFQPQCPIREDVIIDLNDPHVKNDYPESGSRWIDGNYFNHLRKDSNYEGNPYLRIYLIESESGKYSVITEDDITRSEAFINTKRKINTLKHKKVMTLSKG